MENSGARTSSLCKSNRLMETRLEDRVLLFAPASPGYPLLVSQALYRLIGRFGEGASVEGLLPAAAEQGFDERSFLEIVLALRRRGILAGSQRSAWAAENEAGAPPRRMSVWLHVTDRCNLSCEYCFAPKSQEQMTRATAEGIARAIAATAERHGLSRILVKYGGGEPTLALDIVEYCQECIETALDKLPVRSAFVLVTNGTDASRRLIEFLGRHGIGVGVSVGGYGEAHDRFRSFRDGARSWDRIATTLDRLREAGIPHALSVTLHEGSCSSLPELARWAVQRSIRLRLSPVRESVPWPRPEQKRLAFVEALEKTFDVLEDEALPLPTPHAIEIGQLRLAHPAWNACCGVGCNQVVIAPNGRLASCPMMIADAAVVPSGDLLEDVPRSVPFSLSMQQRHECPECLWYPVCVGGCPIENLRVNGDSLGRSPWCEFYLRILPRFIRFHGRKLLQAAAAEGVMDSPLLDWPLVAAAREEKRGILRLGPPDLLLGAEW